jgi:histidinol dehydrogenase
MKTKVSALLEDIRRRGDAAVGAALRRFDGVEARPSEWRVPALRLREALEGLPAERRRVLDECARRVQLFHEAERRHAPRSWRDRRNGVTLGQDVRPVDSAGLYVPGGRFAYPSTVLMTALPARVAGVRRVVMCTPPKNLTQEVLAAAFIAGVDEVFSIGGVAAVGAMAYGTKTVPAVDLIVGPGGAWVTEAKRQVFGAVGIDMLAGPSEIVIVADRTAPPEAVAADLMAQAEHDPLARATVVSSDSRVLAAARAAVLPSLRRQCRFVKASGREDALERANRLAPEHLSLMVQNPESWLPLVRNAGAVFLGSSSPVAAGDYWAGPSHVLPTGRSARFSSGLSIQTFLKRTSVIGVSRRAVRKAAPVIARFAEAEGLVRHAESARVREKT